MKTKDMKTILLIALFFVCAAVNAQTEKIWEKQYPLNTDSFEIKGAKLDQDENLYLFGHKHDTMFLQKQDSNGNVMWTLNAHDSTITESIAMDVVINDSHVYVTGYMRIDDGILTGYIFILKLTLQGDTVWVRQHYDPNVVGGGFSYNQDDYRDQPVRIVLDSDGSIYGFYTGNATALPYRNDVVIIKYSASGIPLWTKSSLVTYNTAYTHKLFKDVLFQDNKFYILGESTTPGYIRRNPLFVESDTSGTIVWKWFEGMPYAWNFFKGYVYDSNNFYVLTETKDSTGVGMAASCIKYTKGGIRLWRSNINYTLLSEDSPVSIFIDDSSNLYITAVTTDSFSGNIFYTYKLDSSGKFLWKVLDKNETLITTKRIPFALTGGSSNVYYERYAKAVGFLNSESDLLTGWVDILKSVNHLDKVLSCGNHLWNNVSDSGYVPLFILRGNHFYYGVFRGDDKIVSLKFEDSSGDRNVLSINASATGARSIELNWLPPLSPFDSIRIERSMDNNTFDLLKSLASSETTYSDSFLNPESTYYYRVFTSDAYGDHCPIASDTATTWKNVGLVYNQKLQVKAFPNPVESILFLELPVEQVHYQISDMSGRVILSGTTQGKIDCKILPGGVYILELNTPIEQYVPQKIIKL